MKATTRIERKNEMKELTAAIEIINAYIAKYGERRIREEICGRNAVEYAKNADVEKILDTPGNLKKFFTIAECAIEDIYYNKEAE